LTEVIPAAIKAGYLPVYVDIWQHRSDPMAAINYGLQEAIDNIEVPASTLGKRLKTKVNKVRYRLSLDRFRGRARAS